MFGAEATNYKESPREVKVVNNFMKLNTDLIGKLLCL